MSRKSKYTKELLQPIVANCRSIGQVIEKLGLTRTGGTYKYIKYHIKRHKSRLLTYGLKKNICEKCGINGDKGWLNQDITIELHHIDGCRSNNQLSNLKMLCPNCHSQTDNYRNKKRKNNE